MRMTMFLIAVATVASGRSKGGGSSSPAPRNSDVVVVNDKASGSKTTGARTIHVPKGHYPPPGMCRVWIPGTPPGHQPKPAACNALGKVPNGAFVLYNDRAYDANHDWAREKKQRPSHVPDVIVNATKRDSNSSDKSSKASPSKASSSKASESKATKSKSSDSKSSKSKATESSDSTSKAN